MRKSHLTPVQRRFGDLESVRRYVDAALALPDIPQAYPAAGPVVVRDHEVPLPRQGLEVRAEGLWSELWCEAPLDHWTCGLEAFAVRLDDPDDARTGEIGDGRAFVLPVLESYRIRTGEKES